jgi:YebC/PmpR family DNA-binding regulatory protein
MAGHSKWKNIQHRKGAQDSKRAKIFSKLVKEITVSTKLGGPDPESNPRLRLALQNARAQSMPKDNIERAIKKASGEGGNDMIETTFEGYGPEGVAVFIECATDNNTRTVSNIRSYFNKYQGSLGKDGCLEFIFQRKGIFTVPLEGIADQDEFTLELIDAGAEDVEFEDESCTISTSMEDFGSIQQKLHELSIEPQEAGLERIAMTTKKISKETYQILSKLIDAIENDDDVQKVYHNVEFDESFID